MAARPATPITPVVTATPRLNLSPQSASIPVQLVQSPLLSQLSQSLTALPNFSPALTNLSPIRPGIQSGLSPQLGQIRLQSPPLSPIRSDSTGLSPQLGQINIQSPRSPQSPSSQQESPLPLLETPPASPPNRLIQATVSPPRLVPIPPQPINPPPAQLPPPVNPPLSGLPAWLSQYPAVDDPNLSGKLASMAEFAVLAGRPTETPPQPGQLYDHQELFKRIYDAYDKVLVMDAPGTGKTCLTSALTEHLKRVYRANADLTPSLLRPPLYKRAYVMGRGPIIKQNFRNELACRCTKAVYELPELARLTEKSRQYQISREIAKYYSISTYSALAQELQGKSDQQLINEYDGCTFIIDEAHNLIPRSALTAGEIDLIGADAPVRQRRRVQANGRTRRQALSVQDIYNTFHRLFHVLKRCKIILLTATPARAEAVPEFSFLVNFLRPLDSQMPYGPANMSLEEFAGWLRGYVSYVRELDTGVDFAFQGTRLGEILNDDLTTVVKPLMMSPFQSQAYAAAYALHGNRDFFAEVRQAANMVYPDSSYSRVGFDRYVIDQGRGLYRFSDEMLAAVAAAAQIYPENPIYQFSAKFADLAAMTFNYHAQGKKGYIYQEFKTGSGVIPLGLMFEQVGIERFYQTESAFRSNGPVGGGGCNQDSNVAGRTILIDKKIRYGLLTPDNPAEINRSMMELYNSPENRYGEYIAVLMFSPVGKEGISLLDIQWMAENPAWLWPSAKQSIFRGRRATSQVVLLNMLRQLTGDPNARLPLDVNLLAVYPDSQHSATFAVDFHIYRQAELAARRNAPYIEAARAVATDCWLEINRNVRAATDEALAGTAECDYGNCIYQCASEPPLPKEDWDYSGLIRKYSSNYRDQIYKYVKAKMVEDFAVSLETVVADLTSQSVPRPVILVELNSIVDEARPVLNRFGQIMYLQISGGYLVVTPDYPAGPGQSGQSAVLRDLTQISQLDYLSSLPAVRRQNLESYLKTAQATQLPELLPLLTGSWEVLQQTLPNLSIRERAFLLEQALERYLQGDQSGAVGFLMQHYQPKIFTVGQEPVELIRERISLASRSRAAHKPIPPAPAALLPGQAGGPVYIHTLLALEANKLIRYSLATRSLKPVNIRLYFPGGENQSVNQGGNASNGASTSLGTRTGTGTWRDANWIEEIIYQDIIKRTIQARETEMIQNAPYNLDGIYGYVILDDPKDELRIVDPINPNLEDQDLGLVGLEDINNSDSRYDRRGLVCGTWKKQDLAVLAYKLGLYNLAQPDNYDPMSVIDQILVRNQVNLRANTEPEARFVAGWLEPPQGRAVGSKIACQAIREQFINLGLLAVR